MGAFAAGHVVLLPFPFSDLTGNKLRPALLLAGVDRGDWIACQITSNPYADPRAIELENHAFLSGGLQRISYIRPGKLFTANESLIVHTRGSLNPRILTRVRDTIVGLIRGAPKVATRR